jgi:hypothetical protein
VALAAGFLLPPMLVIVPSNLSQQKWNNHVQARGIEIFVKSLQFSHEITRRMPFMAKKKTQVDSVPISNGAVHGETTAGYFRRIFTENSKLLKERSNEAILTRWLADHPDENEVPQTVKNNLSNLKSILRSKKRAKVARRAEEAQPDARMPMSAVPVARTATGTTKLDDLELQIDECLILAKQVDRAGLESVIHHLRRARNEVVWKIGQ